MDLHEFVADGRHKVVFIFVDPSRYVDQRRNVFHRATESSLYLSAVDVISLVYIQPARVVRGQPCIRPMNVENRGGDYRGTEGHVSPSILVGGRKGKCPPPMIAHLVKFLGLR